MRTLTSLLLTLSLMLIAQPVLAGSPDDPEIVDACGDLSPADPAYVEPQADICSGWFDADISGDSVVLDIGLRTLADSVDDARVVSASFSDETCRWMVEVSDATVTVERMTVGPFTVLPNAYTSVLSVRCDGATAPCDPDVPGCSTTRYERQTSVELSEDVVSFDGTDATLSLDMSEIALLLADTAVAGEIVAAGEMLTRLTVRAALTAQDAVVTYGLVASHGDETIVSNRTSDIAFGDAYTLPSHEG